MEDRKQTRQKTRKGFAEGKYKEEKDEGKGRKTKVDKRRQKKTMKRSREDGKTTVRMRK